MKDIWKEQLNWIKFEEPFALARVIKTWRSAPRKTGAGMLIRKALRKKNTLPEVVGSVSGGCIENAVIEEAFQVLETGESKQLSFGIEDDLAMSVGLSCGGEVSVLLEKHWAFSKSPSTKKVWQTLVDCINKNEPAILFTFLLPKNVSREKIPNPVLVLPKEDTGDPYQIVGDLKINKKELLKLAKDIFLEKESKVLHLGDKEVFIQIFPRRDQLLIIGAGHISIPLVHFAKELDFLTVVIDPRKVFTSPERFFTKPDHLISKWPEDILNNWPINKDTYAILLTHDPKIDDPALHILLKKNLPYIGALGSSRTHSKRCKRLKKAGFNERSINEIKGPAGADIGAQTAGEIALSIIAEIVASKHGKLNTKSN